MKAVKILKQDSSCCARGGSTGEHPGLDEGVKLFKALADETRLNIVRRLAEEGEVCACNLACCDLAQPTVSHHLKVLREAGLVNAAKRGLWVYYSLNRERLEAVRSWLP